jgi:hypothetical protein
MINKKPSSARGSQADEFGQHLVPPALFMLDVQQKSIFSALRSMTILTRVSWNSKFI